MIGYKVGKKKEEGPEFTGGRVHIPIGEIRC